MSQDDHSFSWPIQASRNVSRKVLFRLGFAILVVLVLQTLLLVLILSELVRSNDRAVRSLLEEKPIPQQSSSKALSQKK